jgi:hypothetical protein
MLTAKKVTSCGRAMSLGKEGEWQVYLNLEQEKSLASWSKYAAITGEIFYREANKIKTNFSGVFIGEENELVAVSLGGKVLLERGAKTGILVKGEAKEMNGKIGSIKGGDTLWLQTNDESWTKIEMEKLDFAARKASISREELE